MKREAMLVFERTGVISLVIVRAFKITSSGRVQPR